MHFWLWRSSGISSVLRCLIPAYVRHIRYVKQTHKFTTQKQGLVCEFHAALCVSVSVDPHVDMVFKTLDLQNSGIRENVKSFSFKREAIVY